MRIRSSFLIAALALSATVALATPSQAGSVPVQVSDAIFVLNSDFFNDSITSVSLTFTGLTSPITSTTFIGAFVNSSGSQPVSIGVSGDTITLSAVGSSLVAGTVKFTTLVPSAELGNLGSTIGVSGTVTTSDGVLTNQLSFSQVVPEPTSMALLGIGMTSFLAFRRFFKRIPMA